LLSLHIFIIKSIATTCPLERFSLDVALLMLCDAGYTIQYSLHLFLQCLYYTAAVLPVTCVATLAREAGNISACINPRIFRFVVASVPI
jgi:hypothetical protein